MKESDNIKMEINIAGERISLTVPFTRQDAVRDSERRVNDLFHTWSTRYPGKKPREIIAMVAYQFASVYGDMLEENRRALSLADQIDDRLSRLLRNQEESGDSSVVDENLTENFFTDF